VRPFRTAPKMQELCGARHATRVGKLSYSPGTALHGKTGTGFASAGSEPASTKLARFRAKRKEVSLGFAGREKADRLVALSDPWIRQAM
jgi:hypothetical protein